MSSTTSLQLSRRICFPRSLFLRSICAVYVLAFASIRTQIRGLYGEDGLEPVATFLANVVEQSPRLDMASTTLEKFLAFPTLVWLHEPMDWPASFAMQVVALVGMTVALLGVCSARWRSILPLALVWLCYLSIVQCGQTFMQFQWDALLLEVGVLAIVLAPWWHTQPSQSLLLRHQQCSTAPTHSDGPFQHPAAAAVWTLRFLFFKFMLMSGSVKLQSKCPTWLGLTALEFHFATQPLPLPLAWYAHHLPPMVHRVAVAATLLLEGPWTLLALAPHATLRTFAVATHVLLQIAILVTGSYNFFNILTVILTLALLDVRSDTMCFCAPQRRDSSVEHFVARVDNVWHRLQTDTCVAVGMLFTALAFCVYTAQALFAVTFTTHTLSSQPSTVEDVLHSATIELLVGVDDVQAWLADILPTSVHFSASVIMMSAMWQLLRAFALERPSQSGASRSAFCVKVIYLVVGSLASAWIFASSVLTLATLDRPYQSSLPSVVYAAYDTTAPYRVTSAYGLFRTMTGVGTIARDDGQRVTVVARPEIVLEGTSDNGSTWRAYHFQYKPGDVAIRPRCATPHQPRLDWQMWFAALGDYHSAPWLVHLIHKLLEGSDDVKQLLDTSRDPFPHAPPQAIRALLYYYDFSRHARSWRRDATLTPGRNGASRDGASDEHGRDGQLPWWTRVYAREYLPALERGNPSLLQFVQHHYGDASSSTGSSSTSTAAARSELRNALEVLVASEVSPFWLAAIMLVARSASAYVSAALVAQVQAYNAKTA